MVQYSNSKIAKYYHKKKCEALEPGPYHTSYKSAINPKQLIK